MSPIVRTLLLLACFFLSGLAALVYQTAWTREFSFVFGTSELAVATVLAAYMGGLAAGAAVAGRFVARVRRPLLAYGLLELGIALAALAVPLAIHASRLLYVFAFGDRGSPPSEGGLPSALFFLASSFAILLVPTALMGATLPLLARHAVRSEREIGSRIGALYATNTFGAVVGTVLAAFFLLPALGLRRTVLVAVALNALVFAAAALLARVSPLSAAGAAAPRPAPGHGRILPLIALSGMVSFTYEVMWTRLLSHLLGGSVYAFGTMLSAFLVGIALGSAVATRWARTRESAARGFAAAQLGTAALSLAAYTMVGRLPELAARLDAGGGARLLVDATLATLTLLPAALCIGATFPLAVRLAATSAEDAAAASARVYSWNTVGAIVGAVGAGFFVLPALGFEGTLALALAVSLALAAASATLAPPHARRLAVVAALGLLVLAAARPAPPWALLRTDPFSRRPTPGPIAFYGVGRSATVLLLENPFGGFKLRTNGLQDAEIPGPGALRADYALAHWMSLLPVLARPELDSMLVVGLGGGLVLEAVPPGVRTLDVIELEPEVIAANRAIAGRRSSDPLADPRLRLHVNDARGALLLMEGGIDAIVSQPSHPWTAGASHLYTREFFELVRDRLAPDGVFLQWMGLSFVDEPLLRSLVATLADVFPHVQLYQPDGVKALLFLASREPLDVVREGPRALAAAPEFFRSHGLETAEDLLAAFVLDDAGARRFAAGAPIVRDDWNLLQMRAPGIQRRGLDSTRVRPMLAEADGRAALPAGTDPVRLVRLLLGDGDEVRAARVASWIEPPRRRAAEALIAAAKSDPALGVRALEDALRDDPGEPELRAVLLRARKARLLGGGDPAALGLPDPTPAETALVEAWQAEGRGDWQAVRAVDAALAAVPGPAPLHADAIRLRVGWRLSAGDPSLAREARDLLDRSLTRGVGVEDLVLRARTALAAGEERLALATLFDLHLRLQAMPAGSPQRLARRTQLARDALRVLDAMPVDDAQPKRGSVLREQLRLIANGGRLG
jgi:spermidine synthase